MKRRWPAGLPALAVLLLAAAPARAHLGINAKSLYMLITEADLVIVGKVVEPDRIYKSPDLAFQQIFMEVKIKRTIKGRIREAYVDFFGHGHGIARYAKGHEAIFFLKEMVKDPIWRTSPLSERFTYYSDQEVSQQFLLDDENRAAWVAAATRYLEARKLPAGPERAEAIREITLDLLGGDQQRLAMLAAFDLMRAGNVYEVFTPGQIARLDEMADRKSLNLRLRLMILQMLSADPAFKLYDRVAALYAQADEPLDKISVLRALGRCNEKRVLGFVKPLLDTEDRGVRRAAIDALGQPGLDEAVDVLSGLLAEPGTTYYAPITYALGRVGTEMATAVLQRTAEDHPSKTVRRYASAELRRKRKAAQATPSTPPTSASRPATSAPAAQTASPAQGVPSAPGPPTTQNTRR